MTDTEKKELIKAAYIESCVFYPAVTYAMEKAAALVDPDAHPVTDQDFQAVYSCPIPSIEKMRKGGSLRNQSRRGKDFTLRFLDDMKQIRQEEIQIRGIDPCAERSSASRSHDEVMANYVTDLDSIDFWKDLITDLFERSRRLIRAGAYYNPDPEPETEAAETA